MNDEKETKLILRKGETMRMPRFTVEMKEGTDIEVTISPRDESTYEKHIKEMAATRTAWISESVYMDKMIAEAEMEIVALLASIDSQERRINKLEHQVNEILDVPPAELSPSLDALEELGGLVMQ